MAISCIGGVHLKRSNKNRSLNYKLDRKAWLFVIPSIILVTVFVFYPMIQAFITSLQSGMGNNLSFVGIDNYKRLLTDSTFKKALYLKVYLQQMGLLMHF